MAKLNTNEDLVINLMNYSPYGALCQAFIMEAIQSYAKQVAEAPAMADNDMLSGEAWKGIAIDIKKRCDAFYNRDRSQE